MWEKNKGTTECDKSIITYDVSTTQCENDTIKCEKKNKETTECDKNTFTCDFGTAQCKDIKCEKKIREPLNVIKVKSHVMLVLHNVRMVPLNMRKNKGTIECDKSTITCDVSTTQCEMVPSNMTKKIKEPPNVTKVQSHVMLVLYNVKIVP